jgi:hypothetical protein
MTFIKKICVLAILLISYLTVAAQRGETSASCPKPATIIIFRTFNFFSFKFSYNLFANDSLIGRVKTKSIFISETTDRVINFHTTVKAPSLNAGKRANYQKTKKIGYPITIKPGQVYFVRCGFLNQNLFEYPRQPTIRLLKGEEVYRSMRKRFVRKKIEKYLYREWLAENNLIQPVLEK